MSFQFSDTRDLIETIEKKGLTLEEFMIQRETFYQDIKPENIYRELDHRIETMRDSLKKGLNSPQYSCSGLTRGNAHKMHSISQPLLKDPFYQKALQYSLAIAEVNACRGKIVSFPTAGSCGIIPGVLLACAESHEISHSTLQRAFLVASVIGLVIEKKVPMAGAEGGCQAECGAAASMAAGGLVSAINNDTELIFQAAALALKNALGLVCDPVAGLVEVPCVKRNAFYASHAITAAYLALNGVQSIIPFDEVITAMKSIGQQLPTTLKESALGGLARTPTGLKYQKSIL